MAEASLEEPVHNIGITGYAINSVCKHTGFSTACSVCLVIEIFRTIGTEIAFCHPASIVADISARLCIGIKANAYMVDTNGIRKPIPLDQLEVQPKHPFYGIGVRQFLERYDEILDYFKKKKSKQKWIEFEAVRREKSKVFSSKIPVYTTFLRPQSSTADTLYYSSIDRIINPLNRLCEKLRNGSRSDLEIDYWLAKVEQRVLELYDLNMGEIETKEGWIRKFILGGSLDSWETLN